MKISNPDFSQCKTPPFVLDIRSRIGVCLKPEEVGKAGATVRRMLAEAPQSAAELRRIREESVFNVGHAGEVGGRYLLKQLVARAQNAKE